MAEEVRMDWGRFNEALARRLATSSRDHLAVLSQQAKSIVQSVIDITPPGSRAVKGPSRKGRQQGQAALAADVRAVYGGPGQLYDEIRSRSEGAADAFWAKLEAKDVAGANEVAQAAVGHRLVSFDGGERRTRGARKRRRKAPMIFVDDERELTRYIKQRQARVQFLVAGWESAANRLGISLPGSVTQHNAPGSVVIQVSPQRLRIVATNSVSYASNTPLLRRIQWALNAQAGKLERQWETYTARLNRRSGL